MDSLKKKYLQRMKEALNQKADYIISETGDRYMIKIIGKGETGYYQENDAALLFELIAGKGIIFAKSIKHWDNGKKVTTEEKQIILKRICKYIELLSVNPKIVED